MSKIISMSSGSINTLHSIFITENPYFGHDIENKSQNNMISPVIIGGFVEKYRALLYMPRNSLKVKE